MLSISANLHCRRHHLHRPHQDQRLSHRQGTVLFLKTSAVLQPKQPYTYQQTNHKSISTGEWKFQRRSKSYPGHQPPPAFIKNCFPFIQELHSSQQDGSLIHHRWNTDSRRPEQKNLKNLGFFCVGRFQSTIWICQPGKVHCSKVVCQDIEERPKVRRKSLVHFRLLTFLWGLLHHCWQLLQVH